MLNKVELVLRQLEARLRGEKISNESNRDLLALSYEIFEWFCTQSQPLAGSSKSPLLLTVEEEERKRLLTVAIKVRGSCCSI